jgi:hypothetical protein
MTHSDEPPSAEPEPRDLRLDGDGLHERTGEGEHHTLVDDMVTVGETIRAILSL